MQMKKMLGRPWGVAVRRGAPEVPARRQQQGSAIHVAEANDRAENLDGQPGQLGHVANWQEALRVGVLPRQRGVAQTPQPKHETSE